MFWFQIILWFCISLHPPIIICLLVSLFICLSVYLPTYLYLSKGKLREILLDAQELVARWQQADPTKKQTWADRQTLLNESWAQSHTEIFNFFLQSTFAVPDDAMCERCFNEVAVVKMPWMLSLTTFLQCIISFMNIYLFMIEMQSWVGTMCLSQQQHHPTAKGNDG